MAGIINMKTNIRVKSDNGNRQDHVISMIANSQEDPIFYNVQAIGSGALENIDLGEVSQDDDSFVFLRNIATRDTLIQIGNAVDGNWLYLYTGDFSFFKWASANALQAISDSGARLEVMIMR